MGPGPQGAPLRFRKSEGGGFAVGQRKGVEVWLAVGASLYWAAYAFRIMEMTPVYASAIGPAWPVVANCFMLAWVILAYLLCRRRGVSGARVPIAVIAIVSATVVLVCDLARAPMGIAGSLIVCCLDYFTLASCMVLWGLAFASLEKHLAAVNVTSAAFMAVTLILVGMAISDFARLSWLMCGCTIASSAIMLNGRVTLRNCGRRQRPRPIRAVVAFVVQRLAYGIALGFFPALVGASVALEMDGALLAFTLAGIVVAAVMAVRSDVPLYTILPALVFVAAMALCLPFAHSGLSSLMVVLIVDVWLAWQTLSSVQLSDLKERFGLSELDISLVDKVAIAVSLLVGLTLCHAVGSDVWRDVLSPDFVQTSLLVVFCVLMPTAAFSLAQLVGVHQESAFSDRVTREGEERRERLYAGIAREFNLSPREREVFEMLAQGYSSAFIADEIGTTRGTAKAHVAHIYQKMGIHCKDDVLNLVESRSAQQ